MKSRLHTPFVLQLHHPITTQNQTTASPHERGAPLNKNYIEQLSERLLMVCVCDVDVCVLFVLLYVMITSILYCPNTQAFVQSTIQRQDSDIHEPHYTAQPP